MVVVKKELKERWEHGKRVTVNFYHRKARWKMKSFNKVFQLPDYFGEMIGDKKEVSIADIGAGMVSTTGSTWPGVKVNLFPSDILAKDFRQIIKDHKYKVLFPVLYEDMENLSYDDYDFDIVHCVNALDHCADPFKAIKEMYRVCKRNGWIYLRHFPNNAKKQRFNGLHQWNINYHWEDCLFESKFNKFLLSECVPGFKNIIRDDGMVVSTLHKV